MPREILSLKIKKLSRKWGRETSSRTFFFSKSFISDRSKWSSTWFHYISIALKLAYNRKNLFKTLPYWSRDMLNFDFLDKGLGIVFLPHFVYDFSTKMFLMLYSINWPNFIAWLPLLLKMLCNMCTAIVCQPGCGVMDFEINLIFWSSRFFYMTKMSWQNLKYLKNEISF